MTPPVRTVLTDLDDTLFDHDRATREALACIRTGDSSFACWSAADLGARHRELLEAFHLEVLAGRVSADEARIARFRQLLFLACGRDDRRRAQDIAHAYREAYEAAWHPVAGAIDLLVLLKDRGRPVVVVTNNSVAEQERKLDRLGLAPYVEALVASEATGCCKPAPEIFHLALARLGADVGDAVMLGDRWATDIEGARRVGLRAVWLNRFGRPSPDASVPELQALEPAAEALRVIAGV